MKLSQPVSSSAAFIAIASLFTGHILWLIPIGYWLERSLERLFIWLFIDPEFGNRQRHRLVRGVKAARIRIVLRYNPDH